jgi:hypothetical protein
MHGYFFVCDHCRTEERTELARQGDPPVGWYAVEHFLPEPPADAGEHDRQFTKNSVVKEYCSARCVAIAHAPEDLRDEIIARSRKP